MCLFSQETHRDQHRGRTGWRCNGLVNGMEQRHPAGSRKNETFSQQTPSTGDYRRAYRGRTESTKGNIKGGGNKRRTRAYRSRETYNKGVNGGGVVHYIYYRGLNVGHDKGLQSYCF